MTRDRRQGSECWHAHALKHTHTHTHTHYTQAFKDWYDNKNQRRRLAWQHSLGSATVKAKFGGKTYDLQTNTLQVRVCVCQCVCVRVCVGESERW